MGAAVATRPATRTIPSRETRVVSFRPELRAANPDGSIPFAGHAAVFNSRSQVLSDWWETFQEVIEANAFADVLSHDVRLLVNHDPSLVLARTVSGTLRLSEDSTGLFAEGDMAPTSYGRDLQTSMARGDVTQMSFAFSVAPDGERWDYGTDGMLLRTITRVAELYDVSIVTYPAYLASEASLRSMAPTLRAVRAARARLKGTEERQGKRNSSADEAVLQSAVDRLSALVAEMQPLLESEQAEDDNDDDVAICQSVIEMANDIATDLQALLGEEQAEPEEEADDSAARMIRQQKLRHSALAARYGVPRMNREVTANV